MLQTLVHYFLHFVAIVYIAWLVDRRNWKQAYLILLATMLVDLDHLVATPIFDPDRCGIGYHPLHSEMAIIVYLFGSIIVKHRILRLIFIGLLFHMLTDFIDCLWSFSKCSECYYSSEIYKLKEFWTN
ncbi:DUF6122 family protein [Salegentibacter sp. F188]|uniref:DUF6122 family protein n=1 Tax=Autumnicola patrickiae TaxID=3075591 RepID=A0ABU3DZJ9_9FLAO|nr:DUF6122 family protein [Salegentibacter sp. F188]MDT0689169.1 DUF6122 family protein [Salegentibacter sp. F188]